MARTRNRQMKQAEAIVQASPQKIWKAGIYTRISVDINGEKRESLETQKLIALSYAESRPDIEVVKFYKDDGISGTKFDRDDFVRMLGDIKSKEINTVIGKIYHDLVEIWKKYQNTWKKYFHLCKCVLYQSMITMTVSVQNVTIRCSES